MGGQFVLRGTHGPRITCLGGQFKAGDIPSYENGINILSTWRMKEVGLGMIPKLSVYMVVCTVTTYANEH